MYQHQPIDSAIISKWESVVKGESPFAAPEYLKGMALLLACAESDHDKEEGLFEPKACDEAIAAYLLSE